MGGVVDWRFVQEYEVLVGIAPAHIEPARAFTHRRNARQQRQRSDDVGFAQELRDLFDFLGR